VILPCKESADVTDVKFSVADPTPLFGVGCFAGHCRDFSRHLPRLHHFRSKAVIAVGEDSYHKGRYAKFEATVLGGAHLN
jgi:hypothetical protein